MPRTLLDLLHHHAYLASATRDHASRMAAADAADLKDLERSTFREIVTHQSDDPRVTLTQVRFLLACIADLVPDNVVDGSLHQACLDMRDALPALVDQTKSGAIRHVDFGWLDALSDRVTVIGRDYRYSFTNEANLRFHGKTLAEMVGLASWEVTGRDFFERVNKPNFDACFAGGTGRSYSSHADGKIYSNVYSPIREKDGEIRTLIVVTREVTGISIPDMMIVPLSKSDAAA